MDYRHQREESSILNAFLLGTALGATLVALVHKPTREKLRRHMQEFLDSSENMIDDVGKKANKWKEQGSKKVNDALESTQEKLDELQSDKAPRRKK